MGKQSGAVAHFCVTPVAAQFTAFDGVIIAASMSSWAAKRYGPARSADSMRHGRRSRYACGVAC